MTEGAAADHGVVRFFTDVWPLVALGLIGALLIRACLPAHPLAAAAGPAPPFDPKTAVRVGNFHAMAALSALAPESSATQALAALNLIAIDFKAGSAALPDDAEPVLTQAAAAIAARPATERFEISGHADAATSPLTDLELSRRRAQAVVDFLVNQGVASQRLQARGAGDAQPASNEPDEESGNRRLEFVLLP
ncbi:MAG TPA: OmpA family protein [Burkholderiaceae bacterium]|jgi:OOP family OmpA-OmpF porin|nr:OmpA family protein [Burkholderiaceae bacterium]